VPFASSKLKLRVIAPEVVALVGETLIEAVYKFAMTG
jgi:hypothetical protein